MWSCQNLRKLYRAEYNMGFMPIFSHWIYIYNLPDILTHTDLLWQRKSLDFLTENIDSYFLDRPKPRRFLHFLDCQEENYIFSFVWSSWVTSDNQEDSQDCRHLLSREIFTLSLFTAKLHNVKIWKPTEKGLLDGTLKIKPKIGETTYLGTSFHHGWNE